jgi:hypothetical protein
VVTVGVDPNDCCRRRVPAAAAAAAEDDEDEVEVEVEVEAVGMEVEVVAVLEGKVEVRRSVAECRRYRGSGGAELSVDTGRCWEGVEDSCVLSSGGDDGAGIGADASISASGAAQANRYCAWIIRTTP